MAVSGPTVHRHSSLQVARSRAGKHPSCSSTGDRPVCHCFKFMLYSIIASVALLLISMLTLGTLQVGRVSHIQRAAAVFHNGTTPDQELSLEFFQKARLGHFMDATGDLSTQRTTIAWFGAVSNIWLQVADDPAKPMMVAGGFAFALVAIPWCVVALSRLRGAVKNRPLPNAYLELFGKIWFKTVFLTPIVVVCACLLVWWLMSERNVRSAESLGQWPGGSENERHVGVLLLVGLSAGGLIFVDARASAKCLISMLTSWGMCQCCGYDKRGARTARCPECGTIADRQFPKTTHPRCKGWRLVFAVVAVGVASTSLGLIVRPSVRRWVFLQPRPESEPFIVVRGDDCLELGNSVGVTCLAWCVRYSDSTDTAQPVEVLCASQKKSAGPEVMTISHEPAVAVNGGQSWNLPIVTPHARLNVYISGSGLALRRQLDGLVVATCDEISTLRRIPAADQQPRARALRAALTRELTASIEPVAGRYTNLR